MEQKRYWFRALRFGIGWGLPISWQGWLVLAVYAALLMVDSKLIFPRFGAIAFGVVGFALAITFLIICWITGEPFDERWKRR